MSLKRKAADIATSEAKKPKANASITSFFAAPKSSPTSSSSTKPVPEPAAPAFDKEKWVESLTEEQKQLLKLEIATLDESWLAVLKDEVTSKDFLNLKRFLMSEVQSGKKVFPPSQDVYSWYVHPSRAAQSNPHKRIHSLTLPTGHDIPPCTKSKPSS